jgi:hypothetical protein
MSDFKSFTSFKKAFIKAIPNFDETKLWFEQKGKLYQGINICFISNGKLNRCFVYCSQYYLDLWVPHFQTYVNTNVFDFNAYFILYEDKHIAPCDVGNVFKFPLIRKFNNDCYWCSPELGNFLNSYQKKFPLCGIKQVPFNYNHATNTKEY